VCAQRQLAPRPVAGAHGHTTGGQVDAPAGCRLAVGGAVEGFELEAQPRELGSCSTERAQ
jgi:hypothetical protein